VTLEGGDGLAHRASRHAEVRVDGVLEFDERSELTLLGSPIAMHRQLTIQQLHRVVIEEARDAQMVQEVGLRRERRLNHSGEVFDGTRRSCAT